MCCTKRDISAVVAQYKPLIKKYAYQLGYEDAYQVLCLLMVETLRKLENKTLMLHDTKNLQAYLQKPYPMVILHYPKNNSFNGQFYRFPALKRLNCTTLNVPTPMNFRKMH